MLNEKSSFSATDKHADGIILLGKCPSELISPLQNHYHNIVGIDRNPTDFAYDEVIEANNRTQINGRLSARTTRRWALGKHTMVLLGLTDDGRVIVADSAQRTWSKKKQRIKYTTVKEIVKYLIPCKSSARTYYFSSTAASGGYVLVNTK